MLAGFLEGFLTRIQGNAGNDIFQFTGLVSASLVIGNQGSDTLFFTGGISAPLFMAVMAPTASPLVAPAVVSPPLQSPIP